MKLTKLNTYIVPGLDSNIGVEHAEGRTRIYVAAQGCSHSKAGTTRRNPDRSAALRVVASHLVVSANGERIRVGGGKKGMEPTVLATLLVDALLAVCRKRGNYRLDLSVAAHVAAEDLGLVLKSTAAPVAKRVGPITPRPRSLSIVFRGF